MPDCLLLLFVWNGHIRSAGRQYQPMAVGRPGHASGGPIFLLAQKDREERRQQGDGFAPAALPLHPLLLVHFSAGLSIWARCFATLPLPAPVIDLFRSFAA